MENQVLISEEQVFEAIEKGYADGAVAMFRYIAQQKLWVGMIVEDVVEMFEDEGKIPKEGVPEEKWFRCWGWDAITGNWSYKYGGCDAEISRDLSLKYRDELIETIRSYALTVSLEITEKGRCKMLFPIPNSRKKYEISGNVKYMPNSVHYEIHRHSQILDSRPIAVKVYRLITEELSRKSGEDEIPSPPPKRRIVKQDELDE